MREVNHPSDPRSTINATFLHSPPSSQLSVRGGEEHLKPFHAACHDDDDEQARWAPPGSGVHHQPAQHRCARCGCQHDGQARLRSLGCGGPGGHRPGYPCPDHRTGADPARGVRHGGRGARVYLKQGWGTAGGRTSYVAAARQPPGPRGSRRAARAGVAGSTARSGWHTAWQCTLPANLLLHAARCGPPKPLSPPMRHLTPSAPPPQ
jgi:hypothetical protein